MIFPLRHILTFDEKCFILYPYLYKHPYTLAARGRGTLGDGGEGMRVHRNFRRLTAVLLSLALLGGAAVLPAGAVSADEVVRAGIPENAVPGEIKITTYAVPNEAQMAGLREDAAQKTPDGFVFYGWYVTGEEGSFAVADSGLENWLCEIYADVAQDEDCRLVLQYLYIPAEVKTPAEPTAAVEETAPAVTEEAASETTGEDIPEETQSEEKTVISTVPQYFQNDYPYTMYGSGTIATSGCSIVSLAMVASYLTDHEYTPDELAHYFGGRAINNIARLEYGNKTLQLACKKAENWHVVYKALQEGQVAIVLMNHNSIFTNSQHFIVLAGINENGKIIVNDSNRDNYDFWQLKKGFEEGFEPEDILLGYDGAWIYDKSAMPEDPFIYYEEEPERGEPRYADIELSQDDIKLLAKVVWVEAQGECAEGQQAVAEVALNRIASGDFPNNLHDVIYGQGQFRSVPRLDKAEPFQAQYEAIERAIYGPYILPKEVVYFATKPTNSNIWGQIGGHIFCYGNDYVAAAEES